MASDRTAFPALNIYIAFAFADWPRVSPLARHLAAYGYTVGPAKTLDLPDGPPHELSEADAQCVIVVWSATSTSSAALHYAARTAKARGALVELRLVKSDLSERYLSHSPIDFSTWDHTTREGPWRQLLRRLRPICGAPPKRPLDIVEVGPRALMAGVAVTSIATSALCLGQTSTGAQAESNTALSQPGKSEAANVVTQAAPLLPKGVIQTESAPLRAKPLPTHRPTGGDGVGGPEFAVPKAKPANDEDKGVNLRPLLNPRPKLHALDSPDHASPLKDGPAVTKEAQEQKTEDRVGEDFPPKLRASG